MEKEIIVGKAVITEADFGFVKAEGLKDVYLSKMQTSKIFNGETVKVEVFQKNGKKEGVLIEVLKRKTDFIGKVLKGRNYDYVQLTNNKKIIIKDYKGNGNDVILFKITEFPKNKRFAEASIIEILGQANSPQIENKIAIHKNEIPHKFSEEALKELESIDSNIDIKDRFDLRHLNFVTIDGEDSRDFDDAVYCEEKDYGWDLYVAIADVAHYVKEGSQLEKEAFERGNSVYFPNQVIPMLPEILSNELCSLNPNKERYAVVVKINISKKGTIKTFKFMNAVIESKARLTYNQVHEMIDDKNEKTIAEFSNVFNNIKEFESLYEVLKDTKETRGALEFESRENKITFDQESKKIKEVRYCERKRSHKIIEEAMLCANICAAKLISKSKIKALYRVHESPSENRLDGVKKIFQNIGLTFRGGNKAKSQHFKKMLDIASDRDDKDFISSTLLKTMPRASYQVENKGHFGLAYEEYTHFTSPIRRYPDLLIHRAIKALIRSTQGNKFVKRTKAGEGVHTDYYQYTEDQLNAIAKHTSMTERRADKASNEVADVLKCHFLSNKIGENFSGKITNLTVKSMFVEFDDFVLEGIVSYFDLPDYFVYLPEKGIAIGRKTKEEFKIGDKIEFSILKVNNETNKVYLTTKN